MFGYDPEDYRKYLYGRRPDGALFLSIVLLMFLVIVVVALITLIKRQ